MDYYKVEDVMRITGCGKSYGYQLLNDLIKLFKKEYPEAITLEARIPKWYFEEKFKNRKE